MKHIFLATSAQLKTISALNWIDADEGQLDIYDQRPPVLFPAALIDIEHTNCEDVSQFSQYCTIRITIRLAFEPAGQTNTTAPVSVINNALKRFNTVQDVFNALQGFGDDQLSNFSRISQTNERRDDNLKVIRQVWETTYEETAVSPG